MAVHHRGSGLGGFNGSSCNLFGGHWNRWVFVDGVSGTSERAGNDDVVVHF